MKCSNSLCRRAEHHVLCKCGAGYCKPECFLVDWYGVHQDECPKVKEIKAEVAASGGARTVAQIALTPADAAPDVALDAAPEGAPNPSAAAEEEPTLDQFGEGGMLGKGSYGDVKRVTNKITGKDYAMKVISKQKIMEHNMQEQLQREVRIQLALNHRNILRMVYYFEDTSNVFLLLELADNGQLFSFMRKRGSLEEPVAARFMYDVVAGLRYLHDGHMVVHRDLKPENILLDAGFACKLADFGWCAEVDGGTRNTFCGTMDYLAPEMVDGDTYGYGVDIWAVGVLLFEMLCGHTPFASRSHREACQRIAEVNFQFHPSIRPMARELIGKILVKGVEKRLSLLGIMEHSWTRRNMEAAIRQPLKDVLGQAHPVSDEVVQELSALASPSPKRSASTSENATAPVSALAARDAEQAVKVPAVACSPTAADSTPVGAGVGPSMETVAVPDAPESSAAIAETPKYKHGASGASAATASVQQATGKPTVEPATPTACAAPSAPEPMPAEPQPASAAPAPAPEERAPAPVAAPAQAPDSDATVTASPEAQPALPPQAAAPATQSPSPSPHASSPGPAAEAPLSKTEPAPASAVGFGAKRDLTLQVPSCSSEFPKPVASPTVPKKNWEASGFPAPASPTVPKNPWASGCVAPAGQGGAPRPALSEAQASSLPRAVDRGLHRAPTDPNLTGFAPLPLLPCPEAEPVTQSMPLREDTQHRAWRAPSATTNRVWLPSTTVEELPEEPVLSPLQTPKVSGSDLLADDIPAPIVGVEDFSSPRFWSNNAQIFSPSVVFGDDIAAAVQEGMEEASPRMATPDLDVPPLQSGPPLSPDLMFGAGGLTDMLSPTLPPLGKDDEDELISDLLSTVDTGTLEAEVGLPSLPETNAVDTPFSAVSTARSDEPALVGDFTPGGFNPKTMTAALQAAPSFVSEKSVNAVGAGFSFLAPPRVGVRSASPSPEPSFRFPDLEEMKREQTPPPAAEGGPDVSADATEQEVRLIEADDPERWKNDPMHALVKSWARKARGLDDTAAVLDTLEADGDELTVTVRKVRAERFDSEASGSPSGGEDTPMSVGFSVPETQSGPSTAEVTSEKRSGGSPVPGVPDLRALMQATLKPAVQKPKRGLQDADLATTVDSYVDPFAFEAEMERKHGVRVGGGGRRDVDGLAASPSRNRTPGQSLSQTAPVWRANSEDPLGGGLPLQPIVGEKKQRPKPKRRVTQAPAALPLPADDSGSET
mmetsp:Transcript_30053/g.73083  ORF Transcript_30053/g.73083 Transcript_30053/m.73083 type:complete len:1227 (+) Transcript_30053:1-3681(+)